MLICLRCLFFQKKFWEHLGKSYYNTPKPPEVGVCLHRQTSHQLIADTPIQFVVNINLGIESLRRQRVPPSVWKYFGKSRHCLSPPLLSISKHRMAPCIICEWISKQAPDVLCRLVSPVSLVLSRLVSLSPLSLLNPLSMPMVLLWLARH